MTEYTDRNEYAYRNICGQEPFALMCHVLEEGEYHACRGECEDKMKVRLKNKDKTNGGE